MLATATRVTVGRNFLCRRLFTNPLASSRHVVVALGNGSRRCLSASDDREKEIAAELSRAPTPTPPPLGNTQQQRAATEILVNRSGLMPTRMTHQKDDRPPLEGLAKELEQMIVLNGPMTVPEYMIYALQHPKYGYYMRQDDKIGRGGDFITAPEISQVRKVKVQPHLAQLKWRFRAAVGRAQKREVCAMRDVQQAHFYQKSSRPLLHRVTTFGLVDQNSSLFGVSKWKV